MAFIAHVNKVYSQLNRALYKTSCWNIYSYKFIFWSGDVLLWCRFYLSSVSLKLFS